MFLKLPGDDLPCSSCGPDASSLLGRLGKGGDATALVQYGAHPEAPAGLPWVPSCCPLSQTLPLSQPQGAAERASWLAHAAQH